MHKWWFLDEGASQVNHNDNAGLRPSSVILCQRVVLRVVNRHHALRVQCRRSLVGDLKNGWPLSLSATFAVNPGEPEGPNTHQESPRDSSALRSQDTLLCLDDSGQVGAIIANTDQTHGDKLLCSAKGITLEQCLPPREDSGDTLH